MENLENKFEPVMFTGPSPSTTAHIVLEGKKVAIQFAGGAWTANTKEELEAFEAYLGRIDHYANQFRKVSMRVGAEMVRQHRAATVAVQGPVSSQGIARDPKAIAAQMQANGVDPNDPGAAAVVEALTNAPAEGITGDDHSMRTEPVKFTQDATGDSKPAPQNGGLAAMLDKAKNKATETK